MRRTLALMHLLLLTGCISTVGHVVTAPVRVVGWTADKLTTSQAEADRNRGRRERKAEEKQRREARKKARQKRKLEREQAQPQ